MDLQKFYTGDAFDAYEYFGAHIRDKGVLFRTYAPNARKVSLIGEFNGWQEQPVKQIYQSGIWELFVPDAKAGQMYRYVIYGQNGRVEHCDPYGFVWNCARGHARLFAISGSTVSLMGIG